MCRQSGSYEITAPGDDRDRAGSEGDPAVVCTEGRHGNGPLKNSGPPQSIAARLPQQHHPGGSLDFIAGEPHEVHTLGQRLPVPVQAIPVVGL